MNYPDAETLTKKFQLTSWIIHQQVEGITDAESVLQLPFRGNCMNWILGHILFERNYILKLLGADPVLDEAGNERYQRDSEPVTGLGDGLPFHELMAAFDLSQERIENDLKIISTERLAEIDTAGERKEQVGELIAFIHWHETYHAGQLEILRQLAGKNDKII